MQCLLHIGTKLWERIIALLYGKSESTLYCLKTRSSVGNYGRGRQVSYLKYKSVWYQPSLPCLFFHHSLLLWP